MDMTNDGSHGRMRILEREADLTPPPAPIAAAVAAATRRTHALSRTFEARIALDGLQFAVRAEPMSGSQQYRLRVWVATSDGQWRSLEGAHNTTTWDGLGEPLSAGMRAIASTMGYHV